MGQFSAQPPSGKVLLLPLGELVLFAGVTSQVLSSPQKATSEWPQPQAELPVGPPACQ